MNDVTLDPTVLSPEQKELLESILLDEGNDWNAFPLSFAQQRLWFLDLLDPGAATYNIAGLLELSGPLDVAALQAALAAVAARHEILRTTFLDVRGNPVQVIAPEAAPALLPLADLSSLPGELPDAEAERLAREEARRGFDLATGPLLRPLLLRLSERRHRLALVFHHIVSDGWSSRLFARDLGELYESARTGVPASLPELPLQYADYAVWQRETAAGEETGARLRACLQRLTGVPPLDLPTDRPRPPRQRFRGGRLGAAVALETAAGLAALGERQGATLFAGLMAVWMALLFRLSGQEDFAVGAPSANRSRAEIENLIGCFVNTLALRADLSGGPTFRELLGRVRGEALEAFVAQEVPFERLVEDLEPERDLSRGPLVQVMLALQSLPLDLHLGGLGIRLLDVDTGTAKFDLLLGLAEAPEGLSGYLEYDADLFEGATASRLLSSFGALLEGALAEPDRRVSELPVMGAAERFQVLAEWNRQAAERAGADTPIHELFLAQAARTPEAPALVVGERVLTYAGLRKAALGIAARLRGVGPEDRVGIFLDRGPELVPALLGTLIAGGAYVPLDPSYPEERVRFMLEDSGAAVVLTKSGLAERLPADVPAIRVDDGEEVSEAPSAPAGRLAYLIYTSGSTGRPKGVAIEHASAGELIAWARGVFSGEELSGVVAATSISFDLSVFEIFVPLALGGTVILVDNALEIARLKDGRARLVNTVPSAVSELLRGGGLPASVVTVNLAGEALPGALVRDLYAAGVSRVYNLYGPSEDTTYSTWALIAPSEPHPEIGRPVSGTRAYVLDRGFEPLPLGVPGELFLGGAGLARGYLGRPELTAGRFLPDGICGEPGARLYRTGDLVRYRPDGRLDYLGRLDQQVKVRGFRVELGEVEAALAALSGVAECAVLAQGEGAGKRLVAFVAPGPVDAEAVRRRLRERLPEHMVPSLVEALPVLPHTPNGKVDRRALAARAVAAPPGGPQALRTPVEEVLAGIWIDALGVESAGPADDFFALGGHSLLAARVAARVREGLGVELPLRDLFERPRLSELALRIEALRRPGASEVLPPIVPVDRAQGLPLSFAQERLWLLDRLEGGAAYNMPLALSLSGSLDPGLLARTLGEIVRRHEALRTRFPEVAGRPVQVVDPPRPALLPVADLAGLEAETAAAEASRLSAEEAARPFDLAAGPVLRGLLVKTGEGAHRLLLTLHHIAADGWSLGVLSRELTEISGAFAAGRPSPLPELPVQYGDYAAWQRGVLCGERLSAQVAASRERLAGAPEVIDLPTDRPRPPVLTSRGGRRRALLLPAERLSRLDALARREGATPFVVLLAGYAALLSRWSHQEDLVIGAPVAGRDRTEVQDLIGCFVNTLVLRVDVAGTPSFGSLVRRAREVLLDAWAGQDLPFEKLVESLGLSRSLSHAPVFQTMLVLQSFPLAPPHLPGVESSLLETDTGAARLDLTMALFPAAGGLAAEAEFHADLFEGATASRLLSSFRALLEGALAEPDRRVSELPVMGAAERFQVLAEWNRQAAGRAGSDTLIHELFLAQAARTPEAPALVVGGRVLTYAGLRKAALGIAARLRGVGPEDRVGIFLDRGPELVPSLLGTLIAGGAYVPLDPSYPEERVRFMLEDSGAAVVLTKSGLAGRLPAGVPAIRVDDGEEVSEAPSAPAGRLAYLIYTSGSTGRPKGVAIEHASAGELIAWARGVFSGEELSGVVAATSISFDLSVFEIFVPLALGGTVILVDNALEIARLKDGRARLVNTVPSAVSELLRGGGLPASVRTVNLAGEALPGALVRDLYAAGVSRVYNLYGPSEDTTYSTWALIAPSEPHPEIGRPVSGTRAYVLDRGFEPLPLGVPGELFLGGAGLARGYLGRPQLTAERFLPDGLSGEPGARLYRTGDLVRYRPDGRLDYLGRLDQQVKVRGFRVELGEVEAALAALSGVAECAVLAQGEGAGKRLVAFVAPGPVDAEAVRRRLRERLPEHMVPALIEALPALPHTPNGKVDRRALGSRAIAAPAAGGPGGLRTPVEEVLAGIWAAALGVENVGPADDFFALGGHSLLAARVVARVREVLGVELPLRDLFERPLLSELALRLEELRRPGGLGALAPIVPADRAADLPLSFAQERIWLLDRLEGGAAYNMPGVVRLRGALVAPVLAACLGEIARRHEVLRTRIALCDGLPRQVIDLPAPVSLPVLDLSALSPEIREVEASRLASGEIRTPLDLADGPVFRARLLRLDPAEHRLLFTVHHIAFDGWSLSVLIRELGALYPAVAAGRPSPLPALPVQYADWAAWQRGGLAGESLETHLAYWRRALADAPAGLDLPLDRPRAATGRFTGGRLRRALPSGVARALREVGRQRGATLYMTLLAAFSVLLSRLSGQDDLVIGSPVAERTRAETEPLLGVFLNMLALRVNLSGEPTFAEILDRVRETALDAYAHQDLPFERLLEEARPAREGGRAPLFSVLFNMLSFPRAAAELPDLSVEVLSAPELPARFDLTLYATEAEGEVLLDLVWNADLFTGDRAAEMLEQLLGLLEQASTAPAEPVSSYSLVTSAAAAALPDPRQPLPASWPGSVIEQARRAAVRDPERTAVRDAAGTVLSHGELAARSHRIARALLAGGVGRGDVVAVWAHRSAGLVEALLGVWKAGAAFAVLDPAYPAARLLSSLTLAEPAAWLRVSLAPPAPPEIEQFVAARCRLRIDLSVTADGPLTGLPEDDPGVDVGPDDLAYVAFTSGSTGTPKAILGTHAPLSHFLRWHAETFGLGPEDRVSLLSGLAHDPLLRDVFLPLWVGATLAIPDPDAMGTPGRLPAWMAAERITVTHLTPALSQWIADGGGTLLPELRYAFFGGDLLPRRDAARLAAVAPGVRSVNFYGATETPQAMGFHVVTEASGTGREVVPVGRGIESVQLLVLGRSGAMAGVGELGEIHVRTPYLSLGYRGDEELTRARFLGNPFTGDTADRVYRTGDLGRYLPGGEVELVGRADTQIKLRGFRIEPAEVEAALVAHPGVEHAVVGVHQTRDGDRLLAAWFVPAEGAAPSAAELQEHLRGRLPAYMVPSRLAALSALPLTPNGKVDRRALPAPPAGADGSGTEAPRSALESTLAEVWARALGRPAVGIHDDFFALGGHSLLASRLLARVEAELGVAVPLRALFERPTVADLAREVERLRGEPAGTASSLPVAVAEPAARHLPFPLTDIQHAYWVGRSAALELGNVASHRYLEIEGELDLERFGEAWRRLVARHDMLRAVVRPDGLQVILADVPPYEIAVDDLRGEAAPEAERRLSELRERMSHQVMATDRWPLFEIRAALLPEGAVRLFFSFDYLIADAWSFRILIRELLALYEDSGAALPPIELSFRDYVAATEALREGAAWQRSRAYWDARRDELPPGPELPLARPLASIDRPRFARRTAQLAPADWARLRARATASGITPSGLLLAAFSEALAAWSKSPRFTLVLTLFNRLPVHPEVDLLVGDFTSTSLLAVDATPGEPFRDKARRLQQRLWDDLDHRHVSGVQVLRELSHGRGPARASAPVVFTSTLGLRSLSGGEAEPDLPGRIVHSVAQTPQVLLDHQASERGGALLLSWDAIEELFPEGLLDDLFAAYGGFLGELATGDEAVWEAAPCLVPPAHRALVAAANATDAPVPGTLLHQLFAERAERDAGRMALVAPDRSISYGELRARSLALAHRLRALGARPNRLVAVVMEKGWEQVVAALAILEAGAAYLPIDAGLPPERIKQLLDRGEADLALTQPWLDGVLAWPPSVRRIAVPPEPPETEPEPLPAAQRPEDLAYVIFTSGSTGVPKGVMIDHRGAVNTVVDVNRRYALGPEDRVFALSALSFDLSVWDVFGLLAAGGAVVFPEASAQRDPAIWAEILDRTGVTVWNSVPALLEMLVDYCEARRRPLPGALRLALLSGDWIPVTLPDRVRALNGGVEVISLGGATEASIWSILYPVSRVDPAWKSIPYGRPMDNQRFFALDAAFEPRPVWVPGELWIGGIGLARGYWRDAEKTAASFVAHPRTGERLYRTGDLGRLLPDGNLEFLGREDLQVKVHGYRIELGEIEAVLGEHPGVRAAVVQAVGEGRTNRRLAAWIVPAGEPAPPPEELQAFLRARLPEYMVPGAFVVLESLPLSANGKVDRAALPAPAAEAAPETSEAELSPLARRIVGVISGVLRIDRVDLGADLFALGASSVEMVRIANLLEIELGFRPRMDELLTLSRLGALVEFYEQRVGGGGDDFDAAPAEAAGLPAFTPITDPAERERFKAREPGVRRLDEAGAIALPGSEPPSRYAARRSQREFTAEPLPAERLGRWLSGLRRSTLDGRPKYLYGSAGGLYPVQVYLWMRDGRVTGVPPGPYYYQPVRHELVPLAPRTAGAELRRTDYGWVNQPTFDQAAFALFFIGDLEAIGPMYGASSRDFCLIEAGLIAQLLEERAPLQSLGVCQVGRCRVETLEDLFRLTPGHVFLHGLLGGGLPGAAPETDQASDAIWEEGEL